MIFRFSALAKNQPAADETRALDLGQGFSRLGMG
jgi:hypothetical protein